MTDVQSLTKGLAALGAMTLVGAAGQGCDESELEPRTPVAVMIAQPRGKPLWIPEELPERAVEDEFWIVAGRVTRPSDLPPPEHVMLAHTKSLGFIGDNPIGDWASPPPHAVDYGHYAGPTPWAVYDGPPGDSATRAGSQAR